MYIFNITYACAPGDEQELRACLQNEIVPVMVLSERARNPRLAKVCTHSCDPDADEAVSLSLQVEFESTEQLNAWLDDGFAPAAQMIGRRFGERVAYFTTILEHIPLRNFN